MTKLAVALLLLPLMTLNAGAQSVAELYSQKTLARIEALDRATDGAMGVVLVDLNTGATIAHNARTLFPTASTIKVPILVRVMRAVRAGELSMDRMVTLQPKDAVGGSGTLQLRLKSGAVSVTLRELVEKMIVDSDNTATNAVIALAGIDKVNAVAAELGLKNTKLERVMMDTAAARADRDNHSTPADMARLMTLLYKGEAADKRDCASILELMKRVPGAFRASITSDVEVAAKTGELNGVFAEVGIVYLERRPFAYAVMTSLMHDGVNPIPAVAAIAYRNFERLRHGNVYGNEVH